MKELVDLALEFFHDFIYDFFHRGHLSFVAIGFGRLHLTTLRCPLSFIFLQQFYTKLHSCSQGNEYLDKEKPRATTRIAARDFSAEHFIL